MSLKTTTEIHGISPEELKESILTDVKKELVNLVEKLNFFTKPQEEFLTRKEAAKLLTEEGELISNLQGFGNEEYDMDEYVNRMERIIKRNLEIYGDL